MTRKWTRKSVDETLHRSQILSSHNHYTQQIHEAFPQWKSAIFPEVGSEQSQYHCEVSSLNPYSNSCANITY